MDTTRFESSQVSPHRKWVVFGFEHGSEEKTQLPIHEYGGIDEGLMEDLNDLRAEISVGGVEDTKNGV